jgi:hypothetical protein
MDQQVVYKCTIKYMRPKPMKPEYKENQWYCKLCIKSMAKLSRYNHIKTIGHKNMLEN